MCNVHIAVNISMGAQMCNTADLSYDPQVQVMPLGLRKYRFSYYAAQVMITLLICSGLLHLIYLLLSADSWK